MAEVLLKAELGRRGCNDVEVASAGTWAGAGYEATGDAIAAMAGRSIDLRAHRSRPLDPQEVMDADVVVVMTSVHLREVLGYVAAAKDKVIMLKEIGEIALEHSAADARSRLTALLQAERPPSRRGLDLDDPMGLPPSAYVRCADELEAGIRVLADVLCGTIPPSEQTPS
jgi:protein-tyrosine phosphatase